MRTLIIASMAIAALVAASATNAMEKKLYKSETYRFDISYDPSWKLASPLNKSHILSLDLPGEIAGGAERCYLATVDDPPTGRWADIGFATSVDQVLRRVMPPPALTRIDPSRITAGSVTSFSTSYTQKTLTGDFARIATGYLMELDNAILVIGCNSVEGRKKEIRVALEDFASSLIRR